MKRKLGWGVLGLAVAGLTACGGARPSASASSAPPGGAGTPTPTPSVAAPAVAVPADNGPTQALVQRAGLKLLAGVRNGAVVSFDPSNTDYLGSARTVDSDRAMSIPQSILLPSLSPGPNGGLSDLFFTVPMSSLEAPIRQMTYQLERAGTDQITEVAMAQAPYDSGSTSFYIPLTNLFGTGWTGVSQADRHVLVLDLDLDNDRSYEVRVDFSVTGFPSAPSDNALSVAMPSAPTSFASTLAQGVVFSESFTNPNGHAVTLWIRSDTQTTIQFQTRISHSKWVVQNFNPSDAGHSGCVPSPGHTNEECFPLQTQSSTYASTSLAISALRVTGSQQMSIGNPTQWTSIPIAAGSSVTISWVASPNAGTPVCTLVPHIAATMPWQEAVHTCFDPGPMGPNVPCTAANALSSSYKLHNENSFSTDTAIEGTLLTGELWRDVLVAEPFITADQIQGRDKLPAELQARIVNVVSGPRTIYGQAGVAPIEDGASEDACQGVF